MCWNFEVSISSGIIIYIIAFYIWFRNYNYDRWVSIVLLAIGAIQWIEAFLWKNLDSKYNFTITNYLIPLVLLMQLAGSLYGASLYTEINKPLAIFYGFIIILFYLAWINDKHIASVFKKSLSWGNISLLSGFIFISLLILPVILYMKKDFLLKLLTVSFAVIFFIVSIVKYNQTWASHWCLYAVLFSFIALLRPLIPNN